jgi:DNA polymerase elongation subunit (family B)
MNWHMQTLCCYKPQWVLLLLQNKQLLTKHTNMDWLFLTDVNETDEDTAAAGAYVAYPKKGMHEWIGAIDINSLYPSAIRALNMGNETIVGQLRPIMTDRYMQAKLIIKVVLLWRGKGCLAR